MMNLPNKKSVPLLVLILLFSSVLLYSDTITLFPAFIHSWSQADRYSLALGFLNNGFDFFHPQTFDLQTVDGITRVDFPINEYIIALIMKLLGSTSFAIFRVYTLSVSIVGLVYLYLLTKRITASEIKSWLVVFFVFLAPVFVYYQDGFIPSIPALAFTFIAYYYFYSHKEKENKRAFLISVLFFTLAALIRMPFVIFLIAASAQQFWLILVKRRINLFEILVFVFGFSIFIGYFFYNVHLYRIYGSIFLDHLMTPRSFSELKDVLSGMYQQWGFHYFTRTHYVLLFFTIFIAGFTFLKQKTIAEKNKKYWFNLFIIFSGMSCYFLIMARQFYSHDYYFLDSFFVPITFLFVFCINIIPLEVQWKKITLVSVGLISVILFFIENQFIQEKRYSTGPWDRTEITRQNFIGTEKYMDSIGIPKEAKILVIDAYSYNVPFILMNRSGYPILGTSYKNISTSLFWCNWDYVAIQDLYLVSDVIQNYPLLTSMLTKVGGTGKVSFYKRSEKVESKSLKQFLGITKENTFFAPEIQDSTLAVLDSTIEYGTTTAVKASELKNEENLKVLVRSDFVSHQELGEMQLVVTIANKYKTAYYQNFFLRDYYKPSVQWQKMEFQFVLPPFETPDDELKVYLWNPGKTDLLYNNWEVIVYK